MSLWEDIDSFCPPNQEFGIHNNSMPNYSSINPLSSTNLLDNRTYLTWHQLANYNNGWDQPQKFVCRSGPYISEEADSKRLSSSYMSTSSLENSGTIHCIKVSDLDVPHLPKMSYTPHLVRDMPRQHLRNVDLHPGGVTISKRRIRWTPELHERFIEAVSSLGGAAKATPKGILAHMNCEGLTSFHIKSHLQKYRMAKTVGNSPEGKFQRSPSSASDSFKQHGGEDLRIQVDVQRRLHAHLEIQRKLQMRIEEHGKHLESILKKQMLLVASSTKAN